MSGGSGGGVGGAPKVGVAVEKEDCKGCVYIFMDVLMCSSVSVAEEQRCSVTWSHF